jgi:uncharacterized SAM-binding protein YcdF (DUF218 family)
MKILKFFSLSLLTGFLIWMGGFGAFCAISLLRGAASIDQTSDVIVVLTGGKNRVSEGLALFASGRAPNLFISGVHSDVKKSELLDQWHGDHALPACCLELGYRATTTVQNAQETEDWLRKRDFDSLRLVTGNYHMNRAMMELQHALPGIDIFVHPISEPDLSWKDLHFWQLLFSEYHKTLYRSVQLTFTPRPAPLIVR